ncbi:hypothetical protein GmHk_17G049725 [Glycine max]|nr:hypothetical protein GmHk_17G049725 [Glycine max]
MVEDVCFLYKVLLFYFRIAPFYRQTRMVFFFSICALTPLSHFSLLLLFFSFSLLNYNGRSRVFIYAEKVEEHIKAAIFISKNRRVQVEEHIKAAIFISKNPRVQMEEHIKAAIFISKNLRVQRRWKNTLELRFLSQKIQEYRWKNTLKLRFLSQKLHEYRFVNIKA